MAYFYPSFAFPVVARAVEVDITKAGRWTVGAAAADSH
jgi:hypothetical protein